MPTPRRGLSALNRPLAVLTLSVALSMHAGCGPSPGSAPPQTTTSATTQANTSAATTTPAATPATTPAQPSVARRVAPPLQGHFANLTIPSAAPNQPAEPLEIESLDVKVQVYGRMARTTVTQVFRNHLARQTQGEYAFTLPRGAAISRLAMDVEGEMVEGELVERERARQIYESIVRRKKDPALLEWQGGDRFKTQIFPIPAKGTKTVILAYEQLLEPNQGAARYRYDLPNLEGQPGGSRLGGFTFELIADDAGAFTVSGYKATSDGTRKATFGDEAFVPSGPLEVTFAPPKERGSVVRYGNHKGEDFVWLDLTPNLPDAPGELPARNLVVALDTSAGIGQVELDRAKQVARAMVEGASEGTRVALVYGDFTSRSCAATPANAGDTGALLTCLDGLQAGGATDFDGLLQTALGQLGKLQGPTSVVVFTDGAASVGELDGDLIQARALKALGDGDTSLHTVALGHAPDESGLRALARAGRGHSLRMTPDADPAAFATRLAHLTREPLLTDITITTAEGKLDGLTPHHPFNLARGQQVAVLARMATPTASIEVTGTYLGKTLRQTFNLAKPGGYIADTPLLARYWARAVIGELERGHVNRAKIIETSKHYGVMSRYTSYLVLENNEAYKRFRVERRKERERQAAERRAKQLAEARAKAEADRAKRAEAEKDKAAGKDDAKLAERKRELAKKVENKTILKKIGTLGDNGDSDGSLVDALTGGNATKSLDEAMPAGEDNEAPPAPEMARNLSKSDQDLGEVLQEQQKAQAGAPGADGAMVDKNIARDLPVAQNTGSLGLAFGAKGAGRGGGGMAENNVGLDAFAPSTGVADPAPNAEPEPTEEEEADDDTIGRRADGEEGEMRAPRDGAGYANGFVPPPTPRPTARSAERRRTRRPMLTDRAKEGKKLKPKGGRNNWHDGRYRPNPFAETGKSTKTPDGFFEGGSEEWDKFAQRKIGVLERRKDGLSLAEQGELLGLYLQYNKAKEADAWFARCKAKLKADDTASWVVLLKSDQAQARYMGAYLPIALKRLQDDKPFPAGVFRQVAKHLLVDAKQPLTKLNDAIAARTLPVEQAQWLLRAIVYQNQTDALDAQLALWRETERFDPRTLLDLITSAGVLRQAHTHTLALSGALIDQGQQDPNVMQTHVNAALHAEKPSQAHRVIDRCASDNPMAQCETWLTQLKDAPKAKAALKSFYAARIKQLRELRRQDMGNAHHIERLASMLRLTGETTEADRVLSEMVEFTPHDYASRVRYSRTLERQGHIESACANYAAAVQLNPSQRDTFRTMMGLRTAHPDKAAAIRACLVEGVSKLPVQRDISLLLTWDTPGNDVDLHIHQADGQHIYYSNNEGRDGSLLYYDVTTGYGPEIYVLGTAKPGAYKIGLVYYSGAQRNVTGTLTVLRNAGSPNETRTDHKFTLKTSNSSKEIPITTLKF